MMVIMFGGKARAGKTTLAKLFTEYLYNKGYSPVIVPFADVLKREVEKTGISKEGNPEQYRIACQVLGSTMRNKDADYWVKKFEERLNEIKIQDITNLETNPKKWYEKCVLVDDCRYLNEVNFGRKIGALQVFVAHGKRVVPEHDAPWRNHESENLANKVEVNDIQYTEMFHYRLFNEGTEQEFKTKATNYFEDWLNYMKSDDKVLCDCLGCMKTRYDIALTLGDLEQILDKAHKKLAEEDDEDLEDIL